MDLSKLSTSDKVIAGSGLALVIFTFLPWYGVSDFGGSASRNGFDYFLFGTIPFLLGLLLAAAVLLPLVVADFKLPDLPVSWGQAFLGAGALAAALVILKLLIGDDVFGFDLDRKFGLFLSTLAAIGLAAGGFLKFQEEKSGGGTGGPAQPGSTPPQPF